MRTIGLLLLALLSGSSASAHHSFTAEFDVKAPVTLKGKVTKIELINPHSWIHVMVGKQEWEVECGSPNALYRAGMDRFLLKAGMDVVVRGYQARDKSCNPACKANGRDVTLADGRRIFVGSLGIGAPYEKEETNK